MREIVDKHFADNWVISAYLGQDEHNFYGFRIVNFVLFFFHFVTFADNWVISPLLGQYQDKFYGFFYRHFDLLFFPI